MADYVLAIDQGTTSSRAIVFDHSGRIVSTGQLEHEQIFPRAGWVEHNAEQIWTNVREVVGLALTRANLTHDDVAAVVSATVPGSASVPPSPKHPARNRVEAARAANVVNLRMVTHPTSSWRSHPAIWADPPGT